MPLSSLDADPSNAQLSPPQPNVNDATGGLSTGWPPKSEYRSRFGEPEPTLVNRSVVALLTTPAWTSAGVALGNALRYSAAAPATCGVAIEVPLIVLVAVSLVIHAEVML